MTKTSLTTISINNDLHLRNLLRGISQGSVMPDEILVVTTNGGTELNPKEYDINIKLIYPKSTSGNFCYATSLNEAALNAENDHLLFLDVNCIPSFHFVVALSSTLQKKGGLVLANQNLLRYQPGNNFTQQDLKVNSTEPQPVPLTMSKTEEIPHSQFAGKAFAITKADFDKYGGFDLQYSGENPVIYIDLAYCANKHKSPIHKVKCDYYHDGHGAYNQPLSKFDEILANCNLFYKKWGEWTMIDYLQDFADIGLIEWHRGYNCPITDISQPEDSLIEAHRQKIKSIF